jgi:hypothetical protein
VRNSRGVMTGGRGSLSSVRCVSPDTIHSASTARARATPAVARHPRLQLSRQAA